MEGRSAAQVYSLLFGAVLTVAGIVGFFYNADFSTGDATLVERDAVLGILDVNGWHNIVHIGTGVLGLAAAASYSGARRYALGLGVGYIAVTVLGFVYGDGDAIFKLIPVNTEDNIFHLLLGLAGLAAATSTPATPAPTTRAA